MDQNTLYYIIAFLLGYIVWGEKVFEKIGKKGFLISQDFFYHSLSENELKNVDEYNFDCPKAINFELLL